MSGGGWRLRVQFSGAPRPPESEGIHKNKEIPLRSIRKVSADQRVGEFLTRAIQGVRVQKGGVARRGGRSAPEGSERTKEHVDEERGFGTEGGVEPLGFRVYTFRGRPG